MGFYYNHMIALDEFADNTKTHIGGFTTNFLFTPLKNKNIAFGGEFGVSMYANEDFEYTIIEGTSLGQFADVNQDDCFIQYGLVMRYYMANEFSTVRPYVEPRVGGMTFFSTLTQGELCEVDYQSETEYHGTTLSLGTGLGLLFNINDLVLVDLNAAYNRSGKTNYRQLPDKNEVSYRLDLDDNIHESKTDNFSIRLGMVVLF